MPFMWLSAALLAGICAGLALTLPAFFWAGLMGSSFLLAFLLRKNRPLARRTPVSPFLLAALFFAGGLRAQLDRPHWTEKDLAYYNGRGVQELIGWVSAPADLRAESTLVRVRVESIQTERGIIPVHGDALLRLPAGRALKYGDCLTVWGKPVTPPGMETFSYREYLARQAIYTYFNHPQIAVTGSGSGSFFWRGVYALREASYRLVNRMYPQPEAALVNGILLGIDNDLPEDLQEDYRVTGTAHIIVISGFNMTILAALVIRLLRRTLPPLQAALVAVAVLTFYSLLVGGQPPVTRATWMAGLSMGAHLIGRRQAGLNALAISAAMMAAVKPGLVADPSFQLSVSATLGLVLLSDPLTEGFRSILEKRLPEIWVERVLKPVSDYLLVTLAAQITTLPVIAIHFQRVSWVALIANPLVLPLQAFLMTLAGSSLLAGWAWFPLGKALAWLAWPLAAYTNRMAGWLAKLPFAAVETESPGGYGVIGLYLLILLAVVFRKQNEQNLSRVWPAACILVLGLANLSAWREVFLRPNGELALTFLMKGDETALLVRTPDNQSLLLNAWTDGRSLAREAALRLPGTPRRLDAVVLTRSRRSGADSLGMLSSRIVVRRFIAWTDPPVEGNAVWEGASVDEEFLPGSSLELESGIRLELIAKSGQRAAYRLAWKNLLLVVPNGAVTGENFSKIRMNLPPGFLLVLEPDDLKSIPPYGWKNLHPGLILWNSPAVYPEELAGIPHLIFGGRQVVELKSTGENLQITVE